MDVEYIAVLGDDLDLQVWNIQQGLKVIEMYDAFKIPISINKTSISTGSIIRSEFLRHVYQHDSLYNLSYTSGYAQRLVSGLCYSKPWKNLDA